MSKTIKIPTSMNPFVVIVNGVKYEYPAGETVEVPDHIAEIIEQHEKGSFPKPAQPATEINMVSPSGYVFKVTVSDEGEIVVTGELIKFRYGKTMYTAERGMTWGEWASSKYAPVYVCEFCGEEHHEFGSAEGVFGVLGGCDGEYEDQHIVAQLYEFETEEDLNESGMDKAETVGPYSVINPQKFYDAM